MIVKQAASRKVAGLDWPTRFACARRLIVHIDHPGHASQDTDKGNKRGPLIGRLGEPLIDRMHAVRARMQAEADIVAHKREVRRQDQARWAREGRGFQ